MKKLGMKSREKSQVSLYVLEILINNFPAACRLRTAYPTNLSRAYFMSKIKIVKNELHSELFIFKKFKIHN